MDKTKDGNIATNYSLYLNMADNVAVFMYCTLYGQTRHYNNIFSALGKPEKV